MTTTIESGQDIQVFGRSGHRYKGKIYHDKNATTSLLGDAIVCLTNSTVHDNIWYHHMNSIYKDDAQNALEQFKNRDDISHIILIPAQSAEGNGLDNVDDLIRNHLHG